MSIILYENALISETKRTSLLAIDNSSNLPLSLLFTSLSSPYLTFCGRLVVGKKKRVNAHLGLPFLLLPTFPTAPTLPSPAYKQRKENRNIPVSLGFELSIDSWENLQRYSFSLFTKEVYLGFLSSDTQMNPTLVLCVLKRPTFLTLWLLSFVSCWVTWWGGEGNSIFWKKAVGNFDSLKAGFYHHLHANDNQKWLFPLLIWIFVTLPWYAVSPRVFLIVVSCKNSLQFSE